MPLQNFVAGQVGRNRRREAFAHQLVDGVLLQRQFQQHGVVLQKVKSVPGDFRSRFEIDQIQFLGQRDVIERLEVELRERRFAALDFCERRLRRRPAPRDASDSESCAESLSASSVDQLQLIGDAVT